MKVSNLQPAAQLDWERTTLERMLADAENGDFRLSMHQHHAFGPNELIDLNGLVKASLVMGLEAALKERQVALIALGVDLND